MNIQQATMDDVTYIAKKLSSTYQELNERAGHSLFKTSQDMLMGHVAKRIEAEDSLFTYLVTKEADKTIGVINVMQEDNKGQILFLEAQDKQTAQALLTAGMDFFKEQGITIVVAEEAPSSLAHKTLAEAGFTTYTENMATTIS